jgi:hypothetical protein
MDRMPTELPEKKPKKPEDRRAWQKKGLFANFFSDRDGLFAGYNAVVDPATGRQAISLHASVLAEVPVCDTKERTCRLDCCIDQKILRKPAISYDAALKFFKRFDVKFNKLRVDTCEVCSKFAFRLGRATLTEEQRKKVKEKWQKHLHEADCSYVVLVVVHAGVFRGRADGGE